MSRLRTVRDRWMVQLDSQSLVLGTAKGGQVMCGSISELNFHTVYAGELVRSFRCSTRPVSSAWIQGRSQGDIGPDTLVRVKPIRV